MQYDLELSLSPFCGCTSILAKNTETAIFGMFSFVEKVHFIYTTLNPSHTVPAFNVLEGRELLKTLWEKKKMLVNISIFFFSHNVFYSIKDKFAI